MHIVDSHCHLNDPSFTEDLNQVLARATAANVKTMVTISTHLQETESILALTQAHPFIYASIGVHPHHAGEIQEPLRSHFADHLCQLAQHSKVIGLGETGLDYYYNHSSQIDQQFCFQSHIEAALATQLPLIVHTREAEHDTIRLLKHHGKSRVKGIIHCFSGSAWLAEEALNLGFYISFSGILTFNKATELRDIARKIPLDHLLIETDAPYLAPVPLRGKRTEPAFIVHTLNCLAELKGMSPEAMATQTTKNFFSLFQRAALN